MLRVSLMCGSWAVIENPFPASRARQKRKKKKGLSETYHRHSRFWTSRFWTLDLPLTSIFISELGEKNIPIPVLNKTPLNRWPVSDINSGQFTRHKKISQFAFKISTLFHILPSSHSNTVTWPKPQSMQGLIT